MSLSRGHTDDKNVRDVKGDYIKAYVAEYEKHLLWERPDLADLVAKELLALGHDVKPPKAKAAPAKERAVAPGPLEKAVEKDVPPERGAQPAE